jgi:hypothetical protein
MLASRKRGRARGNYLCPGLEKTNEQVVGAWLVCTGREAAGAGTHKAARICKTTCPGALPTLASAAQDRPG